MPGGEIPGDLQASEMTGERKFAILFAATILAARKLIDVEPNKNQIYSVEGADAVIELRTVPIMIHMPVGKFGRVATVVHNTNVVLLANFGEKERSRCRRSWAKRREGDREARFRVLQETPS
jgi:hypothetical protein